MPVALNDTKRVETRNSLSCASNRGRQRETKGLQSDEGFKLEVDRTSSKIRPHIKGR